MSWRGTVNIGREGGEGQNLRRSGGDERQEVTEYRGESNKKNIVKIWKEVKLWQERVRRAGKG